ncbi:MAG: rod shape-determining protein [Candidatus Pacebacteria bacterium]|nr:rod shape-determining protein [Candidatus Paceibacterota bacterium]
MLKKFHSLFSGDIGIDLGTANTLVYLSEHGIIINEPSVVALNKKTGRVVAVGTDAKEMIGRTPGHVEAIRPLVDGVVSNFEVTEEMLMYLIKKAQQISKKFGRPRVVVGVPSGITNVETRAVVDATTNAGAREIFIVEEPMAAAIGIGLPVHEPIGSMIIDMGGGTTDIAVISLGGIINSKNLTIAGDRLNSDIASYIRDEFKILIGERTAEDIKIAVGSIAEGDEPLEAPVRGRDLVTGLPREVIITEADIREAIGPSIAILIDAVKEVLETTPPEILADVMRRGIVLVGGGTMIKGLDKLISDMLKVPVHIASEPLSAVARGTGIILEDIEKHREILVDYDDDNAPR